MTEPAAADHLEPMGRFEWERIFRRVQVAPASVKLLGYTLATYSDTKTGGQIRPGIKRLALTTGASDRQVIRGLKRLEELGLIECVVKGSRFGRAGKGMASVYRLTMPADLPQRVPMLSPQDLEQVTPVSGDPLEQVTPMSLDGQEQVTLSAGTGDTQDRTGDIWSRTGDTGVTPPPHESPLQESSPHQSSAATSSTTSPGPVDNFAAGNDEDLEARRKAQAAALRASYPDPWGDSDPIEDPWAREA